MIPKLIYYALTAAGCLLGIKILAETTDILFRLPYAKLQDDKVNRQDVQCFHFTWCVATSYRTFAIDEINAVTFHC